MSTEIVKGNILEAKETYICHQVNCQGVMGSGVAKAIRTQWPEVYDFYRQWYLNEPDNMLGHIQEILTKDGKHVINMAAQDNYGYTKKRYTDYFAFENCLNEIIIHIPKGESIAFPYKIGCGLGGGDWIIIEDLIEKVLVDYNIVFYTIEGVPMRRIKYVDYEIKNIVDYLKRYFDDFNDHANAVIGISGGKDSTVAAALLAKAIGPERVIGVLMPEGSQSDIEDARRVCDILGIQKREVNIKDICSSFYRNVPEEKTPTISTNLPARVRMTILYMFSANNHGRVVNTCNLSEDYVGYSTKYGDLAGDISVLNKYCVRDILDLGDALSLPYDLVHKTPADGMCGKTDEENLGISYKDIDAVIRDNGEGVSGAVRTIIQSKHLNSLHKHCIDIPGPTPLTLSLI